MPEIDGLPTYDEAVEDETVLKGTDIVQPKTISPYANQYGEEETDISPSTRLTLDTDDESGARRLSSALRSTSSEQISRPQAISKYEDQYGDTSPSAPPTTEVTINEEEGPKRSKFHQTSRQFSRQISKQVKDDDDDCCDCTVRGCFKNLFLFVSPLCVAIPLIYYGYAASVWAWQCDDITWIPTWMIVQGSSIVMFYVFFCVYMGKSCCSDGDDSIADTAIFCAAFLNIGLVVVCSCVGCYCVWTSSPRYPCPEDLYWCALAATIYPILYGATWIYISCCSPEKKKKNDGNETEEE